MKRTALVLLSALAMGGLSLPAQAACFGTGSLQTCSDSSGNNYTVNRFGDSTYMDGHNSRTGSSWSQNSHTFGNTTMHSGTSADGGSWNMQQHDLGGGMSTYSGTDSDGNFFQGTCNQFGCN